MQVDEEKKEEQGRREIQIESEWAGLLDAEPPRVIEMPLASAATDKPAAAAVARYQDKLFIWNKLFSSEECARLIAAAEEAGFGYTNYPKVCLQLSSKEFFASCRGG